MNVLALIEASEHVCYRYRIRAFEPLLRAQGVSIEAQPVAADLLTRIGQLRSARRYDVTLVQRRLLSGWQLGILRRKARRLVFDFDDAVLYRDSNDRRGPNCPRRARRFRAMMGAADGILAGNAFLAECAVGQGARPERVHVIPTCVSTERTRGTLAPTRRSDGLDLVWIGSSSTLNGLEARAELWSALGRRFPSLRLRLICDRFVAFPPLSIEPVRWSEGTEAAEISEGHVGVSWVPEDLWSRGKCGLKVLQYMAAGLPVIANPYGVHPEMIVAGETGFLARETEEWIDAIQCLVLYPTMRGEMGEAGRRRVDALYSVAGWAEAFLAALTGVSPESRGPTSSIRAGHASPPAGSSIRLDGCDTERPEPKSPSRRDHRSSAR
jgi:hypothetical protein